MSEEQTYNEYIPPPEAPMKMTGTALAEEPVEGYVTTGKRPQLHFSGLDKLWGCGESFRRVYIERERPDGSIAMIVGIAVDKAVSANLESKIQDRSLLAVDEVKQIARDAFEVEWKNRNVALTREEKLLGLAKIHDEAVDKVVRLTALHCKEIAPTINPSHVQRLFSITIEQFPFDIVGAIDVQEFAIRIRDTKSKGKSPSAGEVELTDQLTMYDMAVWTLDGVKLEEVVLDCLIDTKVPVAKVYRSTRDFSHYQVLLNRIENAAEVITKGAFTPARPTDWMCSLKWCAFAPTCRFFKQPKSVVIEQGE